MAFYFLAGRRMNHLTRTSAVPTMTPAADTGFPVGGVYDSASNIPAMFGSVAADSVITADLCPYADPSFETDVSEWAVTSGAMDQSNVEANSGTYSARMLAAGVAYRDVTARSGEVRQISAALFGGGAGVPSIVRIQCRETGNYLQAGGASWAAASSDVLSRETASWATSTQAYTVEPVSTTLRDEVTLRIYLVQTGAGTTYRDDVLDIPGTSWVSVHGHNISPCIVPRLQWSDDNAAWTTFVSPTLRRLSFYGTAAAAYHRYWRLKLEGTPVEAPWLGELVIGQVQTLTTAPDYPVQIEATFPQTRNPTPQGDEGCGGLGEEQRRIVFGVVWTSEAGWQQVRDTIYRGGKGGLYPMVLVPTETHPDVCILGRLVAGLADGRTAYNRREGEIEILERALPLMG
jgi:hypothetical protein